MLQKKRMYVQKGTRRMWPGIHLIRDVDMNPELSQPPQQINCQFELKSKEKERNEGRVLDSLDFTGPDQRAICLQMCAVVLEDKGRMTLKLTQRASELPPWFQNRKSSSYFQLARQPLPKMGHPRAMGPTPAQQNFGGKTTTPVDPECGTSSPAGLENRAWSQRGLLSRLKISSSLPGRVLNFLWTRHLFFLSYFPLLK